MGVSLYSWHALGDFGGSPAVSPDVAEGMPCHTVRGEELFRFVIRWRPRGAGRKRPCRWLPRRGEAFAVQAVDFIVGVWYQPFRGIYPVAFSRGVGGLREPLVKWSQPEWNLKRRSPNPTVSKDGPVHLAPVESVVFGKLMNLVAHCAETRYDDGEPRKPGWFTIKTMGAAWVVQVKDPDSCCQMMTTAATLDDALALADVLLGSDEAPWEPDPFLKRAEGQKKK